MSDSVSGMDKNLPQSDPIGLIRLPAGSVRVEDPEEEVFLLYTSLASRKPHDVSSSSFPGLGSVDSRQDSLVVCFTIPNRPRPRPEPKLGKRAYVSKSVLPDSTPRDLEGSESEVISPPSHVSRTKARSSGKHGRAKLGARSKINTAQENANEPENILEIELGQDKTALRSKKGDTGSVLWRVSVALGQALLNDLCSESPLSLFDPDKLKDCNVLELGAGTGLLSLIFAPWVRHYTVTDISYLVPLIRRNVTNNLSVVQQTLKPKSARQPSSASSSSLSDRRKRSTQATEHHGSEAEEISGKVTVEALDWVELLRAPPHLRRTSFRLPHADPPDLIVIADCVYNPSLIPALLATVEHYSAPERTCVLVAVELRAADVVGEFLEAWLGLGGWEIWRVGSRGSIDGNGDADGDRWLGVDFAVWVGWKTTITDHAVKQLYNIE